MFKQHIRLGGQIKDIKETVCDNKPLFEACFYKQLVLVSSS